MTTKDVIQQAFAAYDAGDLGAYAVCYAADAIMTLNADAPICGASCHSQAGCHGEGGIP
jgi:hypothetical protein